MAAVQPVNPNDYPRVLSTIIAINSQVQLLHWQATIYGVHTALGTLYATLQTLTDKFVETSSAALNQLPTIVQLPPNYNIRNFVFNDPRQFRAAALEYLANVYQEFTMIKQWAIQNAPQNDRSELLPILDDMQTAVNQARYLARLQ